MYLPCKKAQVSPNTSSFSQPHACVHAFVVYYNETKKQQQTKNEDTNEDNKPTDCIVMLTSIKKGG